MGFPGSYVPTALVVFLIYTLVSSSIDFAYGHLSINMIYKFIA